MKELKGFSDERLEDLLQYLWNPVKELKDDLRDLAVYAYFVFVESGEGIESPYLTAITHTWSVHSWNPEKELKVSSLSRWLKSRSLQWNPVKELKDRKDYVAVGNFSDYVESGEGIERQRIQSCTLS